MSDDEFTTIQVTKGLRRKIKNMKAVRDTSYIDFLNDMTILYESCIHHQSVKDLVRWVSDMTDIVQNPLNVTKIEQLSSDKLYRLMINGTWKTCLFTIIASEETLSYDDVQNVDMIIASFSTSPEIYGKRVHALCHVFLDRDLTWGK